jgi:hypothetical protein
VRIIPKGVFFLDREDIKEKIQEYKKAKELAEESVSNHSEHNGGELGERREEKEAGEHIKDSAN